MTPHESTIKKENKSNSKLKIRNFSFVIFFMLIIFIGFLGTTKKAHANVANCDVVVKDSSFFGSLQIITTTQDVCTSSNKTALASLLNISAGNILYVYWIPPNSAQGICHLNDNNGKEIWQGSMRKETCQIPVLQVLTSRIIPSNYNYVFGTTNSETRTVPSDKTPFDAEVSDAACVVFSPSKGCIAKLLYYILYMPFTFFLYVGAQVFDYLVAISVNGSFLSNDFVPKAWTVVRDLSNIFFILILLYIAVKMILDAGGHGTKQMIAKVIIMALLINFSMFFTQVVVDSSNILALVFYNKLSVTGKDGKPINNDDPASGPNQKNLSGAMYYSFNPTRLLTPEFFQSTRTLKVAGSGQPDNGKTAPGILIGIIVMSAVIMGFAAYCFFASGFFFLERLIELFILIIFSPFAFMSYSVPLLSGADYLGWDNWSKRLLKSAFMAPIFMFFLYFIFMLLKANIFSDVAKEGTMVQRLLNIIIPAALILILLLKAKEFAKKGAGEIGEAVMSGAKLVAGLAVGGVALGTAAIARGGIGSFMKGASTGDTAANRMQGSNARIAAHEATLARAGTTVVERAQARKEIWRERKDQIKGTIQQRLGVQGAQTWVGTRLNQDQHNVEHASHARHDLDSAASDTTHGRKKKWDDLNGEERYETRRQMARDRVIRDNAPATTAGALVDPVTGQAYGAFGSRGWDKLSTQERNAVDRSAGVGNDPLTNHAIHGGALETNTTVADTVIQEARMKQGLVSSVVQSGVTGSYDVRNLANLVAREQTTGFAKIAMGLTGAIALGMRGGFKQMGVNYGTAEGKFFKDLGSTITESLKNIKINVDLSHVGEVKKEGDKGGHDGGHH